MRDSSRPSALQHSNEVGVSKEGGAWDVDRKSVSDTDAVPVVCPRP